MILYVLVLVVSSQVNWPRTNWPQSSDFVTDFITRWGFGQDGSGIIKIYLGLQFAANRRCSRSVGSWSVVVDPVVCHMTDNKCMISVTGTICDTVACEKIDFYKRTHIVIAIFNLIARYWFLITNVVINCTCCIRYLFPHFLTCLLLLLMLVKNCNHIRYWELKHFKKLKHWSTAILSMKISSSAGFSSTFQFLK